MFALFAALLLAPAILPGDSRIAYVGRFHRPDSKTAVCQWPASEVRLKVNGSKLEATIEEKGADRWQVVVDGQPTRVLTPGPGSDTYTIDLGSAGVHTVRLVKRTEAFVGTTTFRGFAVPGGKLLPTSPSKRRLEFIGDSITCGYGNEGASQSERFTPATENAYLSYASITARAVGADATLLAWSGRKMWPDNTMPEIYDRVLPTQAEPKWAFQGAAPDAVVVHLATNDFGQRNPPEKEWTGAYRSFLQKVMARYPKAHVYVAMGSMMSDGHPAQNQALSTLRRYLTRMVREMRNPKVHLVEFDQQRMEDGIGSDWHPSVRTHEKMAAQLTKHLRQGLGW